MMIHTPTQIHITSGLRCALNNGPARVLIQAFVHQIKIFIAAWSGCAAWSRSAGWPCRNAARDQVSICLPPLNTSMMAHSLP